MGDWQTKPLGKLLEIQNGYAFGSKKFSKSKGMPLIRIRDLDPGTKTETKYIGDYDPKYVVHEGDMLVGMDGEFRCHIWRGPDALLNQRVCRLQSFSEHLLPHFLYYGINNHLRDIEDNTGFTTVKHLSSKSIKAIDFSYPPVSEQKQIVAILDEAFDVIATATANGEKNLANARELFESELNCVFSQKGDEWVERTLGEMSHDFGRGKSKHRPRNADFLYGGDYPFVQTGDIRNSEHIISNYTQTYSEAGLSQSKLWPAGTICITIAANIAETGILGFDACFPDSIIGMVPEPEKSDSGYVEYLLQLFKTELQQQGKGSAQDNINLGTFKRQKFPFAPFPEQQAIAAKLDALSEKIKSLEGVQQHKLTALTELKHSILHKAFTGELTANQKITEKALAETDI